MIKIPSVYHKRILAALLQAGDSGADDVTALTELPLGIDQRC